MKTMKIVPEVRPLMEPPKDPIDPLAPGSVILGDKYVIERVLGKGGMGVVVSARHKVLGRRDAIKFLLPQLITNDEILKRFEREARAVANLTSPHVARVYDSGFTEQKEPYIVMEFLEGEDLRLVSRRGAMPVEEVVDYLLQVCHALAEAHENGIVHRDLKPANLFLTNLKDGSRILKVLDFGIAKEIDADPVTEITIDGGGNAFLGTIPYMSPEHLRTPGKVDARADIWALGVIAYELLTGKKPFHGLTKLDLASNITSPTEFPAPPSKYCRGLPQAIEMVIGRCLAKDREARFPTVREFETALRAAAGIPAAPPMRPRMGSITEVSPLDSLIQDEPKAPEITYGKTQEGFTATNPLPSRRPRQLKIAAAGAMATSAAVVGLVAALRGSETETGVTGASAAPDVTVSSPAKEPVAAMPSASTVASSSTEPEVGQIVEDTGNNAKADEPPAMTVAPRDAQARKTLPKKIIPPWEQEQSATTSTSAPTNTSAPQKVPERAKATEKAKPSATTSKTSNATIPKTFK